MKLPFTRILKLPFTRILVLVACVLCLGVAGFGLYWSWTSLRQVERTPDSTHETKIATHESKLLSAPQTSLDELVVNIGSPSSDKAHYLRVKLELELFGEGSRVLVEQRISGLRDRVIETAREQVFERLRSISGKLYFKEVLVSRLNEFLNQAAIRDIHFASFYLE